MFFLFLVHTSYVWQLLQCDCNFKLLHYDVYPYMDKRVANITIEQVYEMCFETPLIQSTFKEHSCTS